MIATTSTNQLLQHHLNRGYIHKTLVFDRFPTFVPISMRRSRAHSRLLFTAALDLRAFVFETRQRDVQTKGACPGHTSESVRTHHAYSVCIMK
jgi:hypothetical protein